MECFEETFDNNQSQGVTSSSALVAEHAGDVAYLEILLKPGTTTASTDEHSISALYHSGILKLHAPGLRGEEVAVQLAELNSVASPNDILAARWLTIEDVRNTTLKHRPDLLASAGPTLGFLSVLYRQKLGLKSTANVGMWSIPLTSAPPSNSHTTKITATIIYKMPDLELWSQEVDLQCSFTPKATSLLVTGVKGVANFDLSWYSPRLTWEQHIPDHGLSSVRFNKTFVATSSTTSLTIHDPKYKSLRASLDLTRIGKKRKREGDSATSRGFVKIISYFEELGKLVTVRRNHLLSFELSGAQKEAMLIDSIGCGVLESAKAKNDVALELQIGLVDDLAGLPSEHWTILQQEMTAAADADDAARFEAVALNALQDPDSLDRLSEQQIDFLLSKVFRLSDNVTINTENQTQGQGQLQVAIPAFTVLSLLIDHGAVTRHTVQNALRATHRAGKLSCVDAGTIPSALIEADRTFVLLRDFLDTTELLDAAELAAIVGLLVNLILSGNYAKNSTELSNQPSLQDGDPMEVEEDSDTPIIQANSIVQASSNANSLEQRSVMGTFIVALERFACFGTAAVAEGLKTSLNRTETVTLIQILRQQLFEGQHTSSNAQDAYPSPPSSAVSSLGDRLLLPILSLDAISKLLLGCIDAVGSLGFLADGGEDDFLARMISELKSETALATQGLEEASYLRGILRETMRYATSADRDTFGDDKTVALDEGALPVVQKPGTIITLYSEPAIDQGDTETRSGILPLSLRAENTITLTKIRRGGGQVKDRTLREVREMENRNKGVYSFERLVL